MAAEDKRKPMAEGDTALARLKALAPERRACLLDAAEAAFAEAGFAGASMNAILAAAAMSKGQAYYYVHDKCDLYSAVIERALGELVNRMDFSAPLQAETIDLFWDGIYAAFERLSGALVADPVMAALGRTMYEGPQTEKALEAPLARIRRALELLVEKGQGLGAVRSDMPRALIVDMVLSAARALDRWFAENWEALSPEEAARLNLEGLKMIRAMAASAG
ncbi:TetR/AcrR family transcriptional regulator [Martelella sp. AMO21009]